MPGFQLSAAGRIQASALGRHFAEHDLDEIISSPLERAVETAELIAANRSGPPIRIDARLIEIASWKDGLPRRVSPVTYARQYFDKDVRGKAEPAREVVARMHGVVDDLLARGRAQTVIVSHQAPIWLLHAAYVGGLSPLGRTRLGVGAAQIAPRLFVRTPPQTASITTLGFDDQARFVSVRYLPLGAD